jgi:pyridoxal/pyridoxine/pyridoxamine kinase
MNCRRVKAEAGEGRHLVQAAATVTPNGIIVEILGGERPHVGAVALGLPRPSLADPEQVSCNVAVLPVLGHKDDEVARPAAARAARELNQPVAVVAGLHVERAGPDDINRLVANAHQALEALLVLVKAGRTGSGG